MSLQTWQEAVTIQRAAGTLLNTFTTAKTVINPDALVVLPQNYLYPGRMLRITVLGAISNIVTTPGTITFQVMFGSVIAFTTGAIQLNATAHTTLPFELEILLTCRATGSGTSANMMGQGKATGVMFTKTAGQTDGANSETVIMVPVTAPAVGTGFDSTAALTIDFFAGFSISNAGNGIQVQQYIIESLN
jgi:hypothetical protein